MAHGDFALTLRSSMLLPIVMRTPFLGLIPLLMHCEVQKLFTTLDLASGDWQVGVREEDREKIAFSTPQGHFEFNSMPFGLTATFQRLMECILAGILGDECLMT
jgi:hypothetical protein